MVFPDYVEFIDALNASGVRYLIVGAQALGLHARPRATKDLDIWLDCTRANLRNVLAALRQFFGTDFGYTVDDLLDGDFAIQLGVAPVRIDLFVSLPNAPTFRKAWQNRVDSKFGAAKASFIGIEDLYRMKLSSERLQDRADAEKLKTAIDYENRKRRKTKLKSKIRRKNIEYFETRRRP